MSAPRYRIGDTDYGRLWLPYCLAEMICPERGKYVYLPLNRNYKPVGEPWGVRVDYYDYQARFLRFKRDPLKIGGEPWTKIRLGQKLSCGQHDGQMLWLYKNIYESAADYFRRLKLVMDNTCKATILRGRR